MVSLFRKSSSFCPPGICLVWYLLAAGLFLVIRLPQDTIFWRNYKILGCTENSVAKTQAIAIEALESCDESTADSNLWYLVVHFRMCIQEISLSFLSLFLLLAHTSQSGIRARKANSMCCNSSPCFRHVTLRPVSPKQPPTGDP